MTKETRRMLSLNFLLFFCYFLKFSKPDIFYHFTNRTVRHVNLNLPCGFFKCVKLTYHSPTRGTGVVEKKTPRSPTRLCIDSPVLNESFRSSLKFANATAETSSPAPIPQVTRMTIPRRLLFGICRFYRLEKKHQHTDPGRKDPSM
jgi:hypothetical protein